MKILVDMNLSPRWVEAFGAAGIEAAHWSAIGAPGAPDDEVMRYARENGFVVLTQDMDFGAMLAANRRDKPSIAQIRADDTTPSTIGPQVIRALKLFGAELDDGALMTIEPDRTRIRLLPLRRGGGSR